MKFFGGEAIAEDFSVVKLFNFEQRTTDFSVNGQEQELVHYTVSKIPKGFNCLLMLLEVVKILFKSD